MFKVILKITKIIIVNLNFQKFQMEILLVMDVTFHKLNLFINRFKDPSEEFEYEMPFDINTQDVTDQNILYISSVLGNIKIIELLLNYKVKARNVKEEESTNSQPLPVSKRRISSGIQRLMSSLNFRSRSGEKKEENLVCPLNLDLYCNNNMETALHAAVKARHTDVVAALLQVNNKYFYT